MSILQESSIEGPENRVEKLFSRADLDVGSLELNELADLVKEVKSIFDQATKHSQLQLPRYEIKTLPFMNSALEASKDEESIVAPDTSILHVGDEGTRTVVSETTVDEELEINSHNLRATNLSMALSKLSAFVSKINKKNGQRRIKNKKFKSIFFKRWTFCYFTCKKKPIFYCLECK